MASNSAVQYEHMPGTFLSDDEDEFSYSEDESSSSNQEESPHTDEEFLEMMNDVTREIVDEEDGSFLSPSSVPPHTENATYLPQRRPEEITAAFEQFQQREQAKFRGHRDQDSGSGSAASGSSYEQPTFARQPSYTAYGEYNSSPYRQSGRNDKTSNPREEMPRYEEAPTLYPSFKNQGSSASRTSGWNGGHSASNIYKPTRQQSTWNQNSAYRGAYSGLSNDQANSTTGYQQSPFLLPGQESHDINNPPPAFQTHYPALHGAHTLPPRRQGFHTSENAVDARLQSTGGHTTSVNATYPSNSSFADHRSLSPSVIRGHPNTRLGASGEAEKPKKEPKEKATGQQRGLPVPKCATLRKIIHKKGETKAVNGQLMWLDPNEPEDKQWKPAVVMDDIRKYILQQQDREARALGCSYLYPDEPGGEPYGDTAFFFPHRHLGKARNVRPDILFVIDETDTNNPQPNYDPGWMMYDPVKKEISDSGTVIVLNPADNPVVNWKEIPLCISPHMDGSKMEYMRRVNKSIRKQDLWARMPRLYWQRPGDPQSLKQISIANTMVNMPAKRFRQKAGCLVWKERGGSAEIELGLKELLDRTTVGRQCIAANSMRGFGRDLNGVEQLQVKRGNANGKYLKHAGGRAIDEKTRNERRAKEDKRIAKAQQAENQPMLATSTPSLPAVRSKKGSESEPAGSRKRNRSEDDEDSDLSEASISIQQRARKRVRGAREEHGDPTEDDDLAMFDQPQSIIEEPDPSQRYPLRQSARNEAVHTENARFEDALGEDPSEESSSEEGEEYIDDEVSEAEAQSKDDDDASMHHGLPEFVTGNEYMYKKDEDEEDGEDGDDGGEDGITDEGDKGDKPETTTPHQTLKDPHHQPSGTNNGETKLSDLEAHRKWVKEMLYEDQETYASSLKRRRTAQAPTRYPTAINPLCFSDAAAASPIDYSEVDPSSDREVGSLAAALCQTKKMFWEWTGQTVPQPNREKSYGYQFRKLHQAFEDWWRENSEEPVPILVGVTHWGSSVDDWQPVKKDAVYYEAYKKGHRAPRDEFGRIVDVPGPLLEKFSDIL